MFDFQKELVAYCESDVNLIKDGCMTFKILFKALTGFNPFEHVTIISVCNRHLPVNCIISNSNASKSLGGLRNQVNQSQVALEWLYWCDYQLRCQALDSLTAEDLMAPAYLDYSHPTRSHYIQHVGNGGECYVPGTPLSVDGFHLEKLTVYESYGCFWHGSPTCYPVREDLGLNNGRCVQKTQEKTEVLLANVEMWKCGNVNGLNS